jgi:uncharacterized protein involved in type VI secretion and phage assembly
MPSWKRFDVKDKATRATVGRVHYLRSNQTAFRAFKAEANLGRGSRFAQRQSNHPGPAGRIKKTYVSAKLRQRRPGAARQALTGVGVLNPRFKPVTRHKSHLIPDTHGGPSIPTNLVNEERTVNLRAHKRIENRIGSLIKAVTARGDNNPTRHRGRLVIRETFSVGGQPRQRIYFASIKNRTNNTRTYHKFTFNRI